MSEFDVWFKSLNEGGRTTYFLGQERNISKEAWNHQQTKIDELEFKLISTVNNFDNSCKTIAIHQKFLDDADVANKFLTDKIDELQARVDETMKYIEPSDELSHKAYRDLVKILKGNKDESIREM